MMSKQSKIVGFFKKSVEDSIPEELLSSDNDKSDKSNEDDKPGKKEKPDEDAQVVSPRSLAGLSTEVTVADNIEKPSIWTDEINEIKKQQRYPWLLYKNGKLGCDFCLSAKRLAGPHSTQGLHLSSEWQTTNVTYNGITQEGRLTSSRKKFTSMYVHRHTPKQKRS